MEIKNILSDIPDNIPEEIIETIIRSKDVKIERIISLKIGEIDPIAYGGKSVKLAGIIASIRKTVTKVKKEEMCFIKLQDMSGTIEVLVFPRTYESARSLITPDQIVIVSGKLESGEDTPVLIASEVTLLESARDSTEEEVFEITLPTQTDRVLLSKIYEVLKNHPGQMTTYLILPGSDSENRKIPVPFTTSRSFELENNLESLGCKIIS